MPAASRGRIVRFIGLGVAAALPPAASLGQTVDLELIDLYNVQHTGRVGAVHGYSVGFTVCNSGTTPAAWQSSTNQRPAEAWGMYRVLPGVAGVGGIGGVGGRIEQIGVSWVKYGDFAASTPGCGNCNTLINGARLGPGCRDTYDAAYNASQSGLGPRMDVNAASGFFPHPPTINYGQTGNAVFKRCQVAESDLTGPAGAVYLFEGVVVHPEDAAGGMANNNPAYRLATIAPTTLDAAMTGTTARGRPAIQAWRDHGFGPNLPDSAVVLTPVDVPGDGRIWVGSRATDLGGGLWRYEYAVENVNSNRSVGGFAVPLPLAVAPAGIGFHDVAYHSGDPFDGADWTAAHDASAGGAGVAALRWSTTPASQNALANAIRWGTMYNFRFEARIAPASGQVSLELFRLGAPTAVVAAASVPGEPPCRADFNGVGGLGVQDVFDFLVAYFMQDPRADFNNADGVTVQDVFDFLGAYLAGCP